MVRVVPGLSSQSGRHDRRPPAPARVRRRLPVLHAGRSDGRRRRLPRGPARGRTAAPRAGGGRPSQHGPVVHPDGRVPLLGRNDHPEPPDGHRARRRLRRRHGRRLSARHVRAHRPDAADPPGGRVRAHGGVAWRALGRHQERVLVGGSRRLPCAGRIPAGRLRQRCRAPRRRQGARAAYRGPRPRSGDLPDRRPPLHERLRTISFPRAGWARWWQKRTSSRTTSSSRSPHSPTIWPPRRRRDWSAGRESSGPGSGPTC